MIYVDNRNAGREERIADLIGWSGRALDAMWSESWIRDAIGFGSRQWLKELELFCEEFRYQNNRICVVAPPVAADMIRAGLDALQKTGKKRVFLFGESLSARDFQDTLEILEEKNGGMIAISMGEESPWQNAAYACIKALLKNKYGSPGFADHIRVLVPEEGLFPDDEKCYFRSEADEGRVRFRPLSQDINPCYSAGTEAMLVPMMLAGSDGKAYYDGFRGMLSSTWWDRDADRYSLYLSQETEEDVVIWQRELMGLGRWVCAIHRDLGIDSRVLFAPEDLDHVRPGAFQTRILIQKEDTDIMLPLFPGAGAEGSLNEMLKEQAEDNFGRGTRISLDQMSPHTLGELMAFLQISNGIVRWIMAN